jgi:hypothetical protein
VLFIVSITTTVFTFIGLGFGTRLGERYERVLNAPPAQCS